MQREEMVPLVRKTRRTRRRRDRDGRTHPVNVSLLLGEAEVGQTLVLDFPQEIVLEERLDPRVLVRFAVRILPPQPLQVVLVQQARREVFGAKPCFGLVSAACVCVCGGGRGAGGFVRDFLPLVLRRMGSRSAFPLHPGMKKSVRG